ncbi:MAG: 16S rRNA (uracil(1498)-N(3))-methyltransferase [Parcubacteria group bacterium]|nr:16S rRNA (uracil(1498)-N(3))-methyltransferase [Parcubacteria group bacterium]
MKIHRFFVEQEIANKEEIIISDSSLLNQWRNVFRFHSDDVVILFDNSGFEYVSEIVSLSKKESVLKIIEKNKNNNIPKKDITLFISLIKKDNVEWVLQKGTEIGVSRFVPIVSERSEKKDLNMERARKIVEEASEQSGRGVLPEVYEVIKLADVFEKFSIPKIAFDFSGEKFEKEKFDKSDRLGLLIGPEGGWTENELKMFKERDVMICSLGPQILRAETASIAVASLLLL